MKADILRDQLLQCKEIRVCMGASYNTCEGKPAAATGNDISPPPVSFL
jgi:hypothetical protein